ncbi:MAG: ribonuclease HII [Candidatus Latescibacterota bacterium]|nr:ribonuclease HII [Candidatus Latescibacterota bacterium]
MATSHPDSASLSISDAEIYLKSKPARLNTFLASLEEDSRKGMRNLAARARKRRQAEWSERARLQRMLKHERIHWEKGLVHVAGVDEVGRGPLAGPVVAAAVILPQNAVLPGLNDSKVMKPETREDLYRDISEIAVSISVGSVESDEIDQINIYQATLKAMRKAISDLETMPDCVLVDGNRVPESGFSELAIISGDGASQSIAAASVVAKVTRDREMVRWDHKFPGYGFDSHKGYASEKHIAALMEKGPCPIHRRSFSTVEDAFASWSEAFNEVREVIDDIKRLSELEQYRAQIQRKESLLSALESEETYRRIDRRAIQLKKPGIAGEEAAENWLVQSGFMILERNCQLGRGEIDLIAQRGDTIAFIEVKSAVHETESVEERVTRQKQVRIGDAAKQYLQKNPTSLVPRFDVITVRLSDGAPKISHLPSAFAIIAGSGSPRSS